ncbi:hypothetical protein [Amycolatopsis sp. cmx-4-54]|uniref:hypothetical protein n=1 Tax=Amycolatopsis sp. cmx-4-54 TaxID=2790936 RepID=UPI003979671C
MVASAKETKTSRRAKDRLHHVHARAGIRQEGLRRALGPELRGIWGIAEDAEPGRVREIVLLRLNRVLERFADPLMPEIVWTAYNLGVDPVHGGVGMVGRIRTMVGRGRVPVSERTCTRRFYDFLGSVKNSLDGFQEDLTGEDFRVAARWIAENVRPERERSPRDPVPSVMRMFLDGTVWGPADEAGAPVPARLGAHGDWLCVFTDERLLAEYRAVTGAGWGRIRHRTGREVVLAAAGRAAATGVLVNPRPTRGAGIHAALPLSPESVARLAVRR